MKIWYVGDKVRYYLNSRQYTDAEIVEKCEDDTVWVALTNGQEKQMRNDELIEL